MIAIGKGLYRRQERILIRTEAMVRMKDKTNTAECSELTIQLLFGLGFYSSENWTRLTSAKVLKCYKRVERNGSLHSRFRLNYRLDSQLVSEQKKGADFCIWKSSDHDFLLLIDGRKGLFLMCFFIVQVYMAPVPLCVDQFLFRDSTVTSN